MQKNICITLLAFLLSLPAFSQNCNTINLPDTLNACKNSIVHLNAQYSGVVDSIGWWPLSGFTNSAALSTYDTMGASSGYRYIKVKTTQTTNLVANSNFNSGNSGFTTTYTYGSCNALARVDVTTNPQISFSGFISYGDHTTGTGNMLVVNGDTVINGPFWCETLTVTPNTDYVFSVWTANCSSTLMWPAAIQLKINGSPVGGQFQPAIAYGQWTNYNTTWNSGSNTSISMCLYDMSTAYNGNDFTVDDIMLSPVCITTDSVYVRISDFAPVISATEDTCKTQLQLSVNDESNPDIQMYTWNYGDNNTGSGNPVTHFYSDSGNYLVTLFLTDIYGCKDTLNVQEHVKAPKPINLQISADTTVCKGQNVQLHVSGAVSYSWSPGVGLSNSAISDPLATVSNNSVYTVTGTDSVGCTGKDSVSISVFPAPVIQLSSDGRKIRCNSDTVQLFAAGLVNYKWQPANYCNNSTSDSPVVFAPYATTFTVTGLDANGCLATDSIAVTEEKDLVLFVPNAFTPNNDGLNDIIRPLIFCDFVLEQFSIYDRWGTQVYTTQIAGAGWNGRLNGTDQPIGVFYYFLKGHKSDGEKIMLKGDFTLLR